MLKAVCVFDTGGKLRAQCQTSVTSTITSWHTLIIENHEWSSHGVTALQSRLQFSRGTRQQARTCDRLQLDPLVSSEQTTNPPVRVIYNLPKPDIYASADAPDLTPPPGTWSIRRLEGEYENKRTRPPCSPSPCRLYLWAQACSTSAMVFGASRERTRGAPGCWITTSSSILTPRPRKRFGARSLSSLMYKPGMEQRKIRRRWPIKRKLALGQKSK